jgi:fumarylacetoacetate (FAA) hydrolase family protein
MTADPRPDDRDAAALLGRVWNPAADGPCVVAVRGDDLVDITAQYPTMRDACEDPDCLDALRSARGEVIASLPEVLANTPPATRDRQKAMAASPHRPAGRQGRRRHLRRFHAGARHRGAARGQPERAAEIRGEIQATVGDDLRALIPGSEQAAALKQLLIQRGMWSQYLEVGIGPDAEIFSKAQPMSPSATSRKPACIRSPPGTTPSRKSCWSSPAPAKIVGATLGNDVNLRDVEGRSALLFPRPRTTTPAPRSARLSASSTTISALTTCAPRKCG